MYQSPSFFLRRIEYGKPRTKVISRATHNGHRQSSEPIKHLADVKRGKIRASEPRRFYSYLRLDGKLAKCAIIF